MAKVKLSVAQQIDNAKDGRTDKWVAQELQKELGGKILSRPGFSQKKNGYKGLKFSEPELCALSKVLGVEISID